MQIYYFAVVQLINIYDKRDDSNFYIVQVPFSDDDIPLLCYKG